MKHILVCFFIMGLAVAFVHAQEATMPAAEPQVVEIPAPPEPEEPAPAEKAESVAKPAAAKPSRVSYNPKVRRDPTLSQDDELLIEQQRKKREAALKKYQDCLAAKEAAEREKERLEREYQLCLLKHPEAQVVNRIFIDGIIGQDVLIRDKVYGPGDTYLKAKITSINPETESVVFSYKGVTFTKKLGAKGRREICRSSKLSREFSCELYK